MFWSVSGHRGWCQNGLSIIDAHHHHGHHKHHHHDKHNGVDLICDFLLVCAKGLCCLLLLWKQLHLLHSKELQDVALGVHLNNIMGGGLLCARGASRLLWDRARHLSRLCRLLQEPESRGLSYGAGVYQQHYGIRTFCRQQPPSTAMLEPVTVHLRGISCCLLYTSPSPRDQRGSRMPSSA